MRRRTDTEEGLVSIDLETERAVAGLSGRRPVRHILAGRTVVR